MSEPFQTRLDLASSLLDRRPEIVGRSDERQTLQETTFVLRQIPIEVPEAVVESIRIVLDPHELAQRLHQTVLISGERVEPMPATP